MRELTSKVSVPVLCALLGVAACRDAPSGGPEKLHVLRPVTAPDGKPLSAPGPDGESWPVLEALPAGDPLVAVVADALDQQFAGEAAAVLRQVKTYVRTRLEPRGDADKRWLASAKTGSAVVLGAPEGLPRRGAFMRVEGDDKKAPDLLWVPVPRADLDVASGTLEQALAGRIGRLSAWLMLDRSARRVAADGTSTVAGGPWLVSDPLTALVDGYGLHLETVARRVSRSGKLGPPGSVEQAKDDAAMRVAAIMGGRYAYRAPEPTGPLTTPQAIGEFLSGWATARPPSRGEPWRGSQMVSVPGVVANVLNTLADDPAVALEAPPAKFFAPFYGDEAPAADALKKLPPTQVVELKILHALHERLAQPDAPAMPGVHTLVDGFVLNFPAAREAALKALLAGTFARVADTRSVGALEAAGVALTVTNEVLAGSRFPDGAVGAPVLVRLPRVTVARAGQGEGPLVFNLNAAMPWQLALMPGMPRDMGLELHGRLEKTPLTRLDELAGQIPAEAYSSLVPLVAQK